MNPLLPPSPADDVWVALDLETTGLSPQDDEIIEIGAVKFQGDDLLDSYQTFVNPGRRLNDFVRRYTGISQAQVNAAPRFSGVAADLLAFVGASPIVGHNIAFDLRFLHRHQLRLNNPRCDTWDMAYVTWPERRDYSLGGLAAWLKVPHERPHRALDDAKATRGVFLKLLGQMSELDVYTVAEMQRLAGRSSWVLSHILGKLQDARLSGSQYLLGGGPSGPSPAAGVPDISGLDTEALQKRLRHGRALRPDQAARDLDVDDVAALFDEDGPLARALGGYESRTEQLEMAVKVAEAINDGQRLIVEAGTGVGKSLAYLLPAALHALANNRRVVVSTNTINLQEQLLTKDVPVLVRALEGLEDVPAQEFRFTQLKGRANYLCMRRWERMRSDQSLTEDEARMVAKTLVWLQTTSTADRSEMNLGHRSAAAPWDRLSAQGARDCHATRGPCFLRSARDKAAASHLVIVNHALLLSDLATGGRLIPDYDVLIIDEAHRLEEEATRHLGFEVAQSRVDDQLQALLGLLNTAVASFRGSTASQGRRQTVEEAAAAATGQVPRVRDQMAAIFSMVARVLGSASENDRWQELRITSATRAQPGWSEVEIQGENVRLALADLTKELRRLSVALEGLEDANLIGYEGLVIEVDSAFLETDKLAEHLEELISKPKPDIYWASRGRQGSDLVLNAAPLHVGETLDQQLFSEKECVVMTSATLSANGSFDHVTGRTGFGDCEELLLGSPFDYERAAMICVPGDMPEPTSRAYPEAVNQAVMESAMAADGHTMALFTSHAALQASASALRDHLQANGITVLAQGVDGTPAQLLRRFREEPKSVLLGTASFWEGVDLPGDSLKVLLVSRLPFNVPSEPVFASRSEQYDDQFGEYAVPQAILRLRQGVGRLIRTKTDRGVVVLLDRRIVSRRYGRAFLDSLPPGTLRSPRLLELSSEIRGWLE